MPPRKTPICGECWADGWPWDAVAASCVHGQWERKAADPEPEPTLQDADPAPSTGELPL